MICFRVFVHKSDSKFVWLRCNWMLAGHMLRSTSPLCFLFARGVEVHNVARQRSWRRYRTGPDGTGFSGPHKFLKDQSVDLSAANDRTSWKQLEQEWVAQFPVIQHGVGQNVWVKTFSRHRKSTWFFLIHASKAVFMYMGFR